MSVDWGTTSTVDEGVAGMFRATLVDRARKREVRLGDGSHVVIGNRSLGDSYPTYVVTDQDQYHHCTCQDHGGGEYRRVCSHIVAVMLEKEQSGVYTSREEESGPELQPSMREHAFEPATTLLPATSQVGAREPSVLSPSPAPEPRLDPHDDSWGSPPFPEWVEGFRQHQEEAIEDILEAYERGAAVVFLDAPTGSGKTLIAEAVRRRIGGYALYSCTTKTLQDQVMEDYDYAAVLKGQSNYATELAPWPDVTAADCTGPGCNWCVGTCPYQIAKNQALGSRFAVVNSAYLLTAWNGPRTFQGRDLVVLDECDLLEGALMGFVEVRISRTKQERYGIGRPEKKTVPESWLEWVRDVLPVLRQALGAIPEDTQDVKQIREGKWLSSTVKNLMVLKEGLEGEEIQWVYQTDNDAVVFKPVEVREFGGRYLWQHGKRFLVMSASIISAAEMAESLGLEDQWEVVKVQSTFPVENRPVKAVYAGKVTAKTYQDVIDHVAEHVSVILAQHDGERVLVHTVSYKMATDLYDKVRTNAPKRTYTNAGNREETLNWMKRTKGAVVFAPSFDRGVDLPGDLCRVQIIAKVPYPYLGDEQVKARLYGTRNGKLWYAVQTVRSLIQMTGRAVRSSDDWAVTYILDKQFHDFYRRNRRLFPDWWREALDVSGRARSLLGL